MKQMGVAALLGMLGLVVDADAAPVTYDVSGHGSIATVTSAVPDPPGYVTTFFSPGSSVTLDLDRNGNGVIGDVALVSATLVTDRTLDFGGLGAIHSNAVLTLSGGQGALPYTDIYWDPAVPTAIQQTGTFTCTGQICLILGIDPGQPRTLDELDQVIGQLLVPPTLSYWRLSPDLSQILGSTRAVYKLSGPSGPLGFGEPAEWILFGPLDLNPPVGSPPPFPPGRDAPEPGLLALVLLMACALVARAQRPATSS